MCGCAGLRASNLREISAHIRDTVAVLYVTRHACPWSFCDYVQRVHVVLCVTSVSGVRHTVHFTCVSAMMKVRETTLLVNMLKLLSYLYLKHYYPSHGEKNYTRRNLLPNITKKVKTLLNMPLAMLT